MSSLNSYEEIDLKINLNRFGLVLRRRWLPSVGVFMSVIALALIYLALKKPVYKSSGSILVKPQNSSLPTGFNTDSVGELEALGKQSDPLITEMEMIRSRPILELTAKALSYKMSDMSDDISILSLEKGIEVDTIPGTDILKISYQSLEPIVAAAVVNTLIEVYIEKNIQNNRVEVVAAREFIESQLPKTAAAVREAEQKLSLFKEQSQIVALDDESSQTIKSLAELENILAQAQAELAELNAQSAELQRNWEMGLETVSNSRQMNFSPSFQEVSQQLRQVQNQLVIDRNRYHSPHPAIENLEQQEAELQARLHKLQVTQLKVQRLGLERRISKLLELQATQKAKKNTYPQLEQTQRELEGNFSAARITHESLLKSLQEARIAENQTIANVQIISTAQVPEEPDTTSRRLILFGGSILGTLMALATAFIIDLFVPSVKDVQQAKTLLDYPFLGIIPFFTTSKSFVSFSRMISKQEAPRVYLENDPNSIYMIYAYNLLQHKLSSLNLDRDGKVIVITSSVPKEGKSEVCANLAAAFARAGQRILLVDADLYEPSQHQAWVTSNTYGLGEVLAGQAKLQNVLHEPLVNLFFLSAGQLSANAVLDIRQLFSLINSIRKDYDVIIIDTPSIVSATDSSHMSKLADCTLLVVRPEIVDIRSIEIAKQALNFSDRQLLGIVANAVKQDNVPSKFVYSQSTDNNNRILPSI